MRLPCQSQGVAVAFEKVTVTLGGNIILDNISAKIPQGSCTAVVGPNGAGKTTMLMALLGEVRHTGTISVSRANEGRPLRIGYVPQRLQFDRGMPLTVCEFLVMGWQRSPLWFGIRQVFADQALALLAAVNMEGMAQRKIGALSGGEMQRVLLALALGQNPDLLVLDEPASGVDFQGEHVFCELLDSLRHEQGFTQLMVSHDLSTVTHHATHVICLNRKVAAEGPPREVLTRETLMAIFGLHLGLVDSRAFPGDLGTCSSSCCSGDADRA
jgi:zinc transport system ATP-binding protein